MFPTESCAIASVVEVDHAESLRFSTALSPSSSQRMADAQIWDVDYVFRRETVGIHGIWTMGDSTETTVD